MFGLKYMLDDGSVVGEIPNARTVPARGSTVTLEHAALGMVRYEVVTVPDHLYRSRTGRLATANQYTEVGVIVGVRPIKETPR